MPRGTQFSVLQSRLRSELQRSNSVAVGVDDLPSLKETLNHQYNLLYLSRDWAHLRKVFSKTLSAGTRYYDPPTGLNTERVEQVAVEWSNHPYDVLMGIGFDEYAQFDSDSDERSDPVRKWDVRWTGTTQIEVWPLPTAEDQTLRLRGIQDAPRLVNDTDPCLLDDNVVVLHAAAELVKDENEKKIKLALADKFLAILTSRQRGRTGHQLGLGRPRPSFPTEITIRTS